MIDIRLSDNLELMAEMQDNSVDLIYCDILYGTGKDFMDYKDLYPMREIIEEHYLPRLKEMHRVLKSTGSIYLQMDYRIVHWVRCLMDDIFNYGNFRNEIIWCYNGGGRTLKNWNKKHDNIIFYTKSKEFIFNTQYQEYNDNSKKRLKNKHKGIDKSFKIDIGTPFVDWWSDLKCIVNPQNDEYVKYNTQKPKALIERIIKASSNEGDLVADFYAGSFTTAEVCKDLNRNFIGCDISEKAVAIGLERTKY